MTPWIDPIDKLRSLGYSFALNEGRLKYTYAGKGNLPQDEVTPLLEVLKRHKGEILNDPYFLIEQSLEEVDQGYEPGALEWMKADRPDKWGKMLTLEGEINKMALGDDLDGLRGALNSYREVILAMVKEFKFLKEKKGQGIFNFADRPIREERWKVT